MNFKTNIEEALSSIKANKLRSIITSMIIAIGITALIGILTTIDGIKSSISSNLSAIGSNAFNIEAKGRSGRRHRGGKKSKVYPAITYRQALEFQKNYNDNGVVSLRTFVSGTATVKYEGEKTNPNIKVHGVDEHYVFSESIELEKGRNFAKNEINYGSNVVIIGGEISNTIFGKLSPIDKKVNIFGQKFKVIGVITKKGSMMGGSGNDRAVILPLNKARNLALNSDYTYNIKVSLGEKQDVFTAIEQSMILMKMIRKDELGAENSFEIKKSDSLLQKLDETSSTLKMGGFFISLIVLLGASIALVNIMLVSVTERTKEIGVRKALGATPKQIKNQFLIEAIVICVIGGIAGVVFGLLLGNIVSVFMGSNEFIAPWFWMFVGIVICIVVGVVSGIIPAIKASKLDPIDALRYE